MKNCRRILASGLAISGLCMLFAFQTAAGAQAAGQESAKKADATQEEVKKADVTHEELAASVPALSELHEVVYPLWHTAFPNKDYDLIKELLPQADSLTAKLDGAKLPGILRDKQAAWDEGKTNLKAALQQLHAAAETNNQEEMLNQTEAFHAAFERLVRTIRPIVPELDAFHQEMYKLYHYYAPQYDLAQIRSAVAAMQEKIPALKKSQLPKRLADRQKDFEAAVGQLEASVADLAKIVKTDSKEKILDAVEKTHTAYRQTERIFE